jgi:hypothetical protein
MTEFTPEFVTFCEIHVLRRSGTSAWQKNFPPPDPGIGPTIATAIATTVADPKAFRSGREFAAWLGLVPRQNSTGGNPAGRHHQARQPLSAPAAHQRGKRQSAPIEGDQSRSVDNRAASAAAAAGRSRGAGEQDGAHRLGGDAAREGIPAQGCGGLVAHGTWAGACERAMTRDGTVGRSDATERSLPLHWDIDPARMMRPRFADSIRSSRTA